MNFATERLLPDGPLLIRPRSFSDARGTFTETYRRSVLEEAGIGFGIVQENQSVSRLRGTVRGLHLQVPPREQAKLVRVARGSIFDVAVDLRRVSPTYGRWVGATLTEAEGQQLFVPRGFAHGFCTLEPDTVVLYGCDEYYAPDHEAGVHFADPDLAIDWPINLAGAILSPKDANLPLLAQLADVPFQRS